jgi:uncharacterized RDD family membrane protein YckC
VTCPACGEPIVGGRQRCSSCGAMVQPPTEGSLAPVAAPANLKTEPIRQIPALQKKERPTWKDEVTERVRHRRRRRHPDADEGLPLFEQKDGQETTSTSPAPAEAPRGDWSVNETPQDDDLPLQRPGDDSPASAPELLAEPRTGYVLDEPSFDHDPESGEGDEWSLGAAPSRVGEPRPVERPAFLGERARAAALDAAFLAALASLVVYFASRRAGVPLLGLRPVWPYLLGYVAFLCLFYATYFTGATGQTLGKLATGLRVADRRGAPPTYSRALLRAALGTLGIGLALVGLAPMLFDPARRAFHDRVFKTRVIRG